MKNSRPSHGVNGGVGKKIHYSNTFRAHTFDVIILQTIFEDKGENHYSKLKSTGFKFDNITSHARERLKHTFEVFNVL